MRRLLVRNFNIFTQHQTSLFHLINVIEYFEILTKGSVNVCTLCNTCGVRDFPQV